MQKALDARRAAIKLGEHRGPPGLGSGKYRNRIAPGLYLCNQRCALRYPGLAFALQLGTYVSNAINLRFQLTKYLVIA